jgi:EmrB/QacA subfamily drug resistance transporter
MRKDSEASIRRAALVIATMGAFLAPFMGSSTNIALPSIGTEFAVSAVLLSWVQTSYLLAAAMFLLPMGKFADIHGRKRVFAYGIVMYTVASLSCGIATSATMLISSRVLQGIGSALLFGTGTAILTSVFPIGERGRALGINAAATYLGLSLGPVLGGFLTQHFGWRSIFLVNVPLGLAIIAYLLTALKGEWAEAKGEKFDLAGSIISGLALVAITYGFTVPRLLIVGIAGILVFIWWETKAEAPLLDMRLFSGNTVFAFSNLAALVNYSATFAVTFLLSLYLQYMKGFDPERAGLILIAQPVMMTVFSPLAGRLSDRIESRVVASVGMAVTAIGLFLLSLLNESSHVAFAVGSLMLLGFGFALFSSPNTNAIMSSVEKRFYGVASATLGTMRLTGQMLSMSLATLIIAMFLGNAQIAPSNYTQLLDGTRWAFVMFAVLCFLGMFASLARGKVR